MTDWNRGTQPIGAPVNPAARPLPPRIALEGRHCRVVPLDVGRDAQALWEAISIGESEALWTYMADGPFAHLAAYREFLERGARSDDPLFFAIQDARTGSALGTASYLRIDPRNASIEVGSICYSPLLQRTISATEAMYLMMQHAFALGYRRYEWKCNALNLPSRVAAQRLGFSYEGTFRQHMIVKGRNRDTAWYAIVDGEWPQLQPALLRWLEPSNFDANGRQLESLSDLTRPMLHAIDPVVAARPLR